MLLVVHGQAGKAKKILQAGTVNIVFRSLNYGLLGMELKGIDYLTKETAGSVSFLSSESRNEALRSLKCNDLRQRTVFLNWSLQMSLVDTADAGYCTSDR